MQKITVVTWLLLGCCLSPGTGAQTTSAPLLLARKFDGFYLGATAGTQNIFGGALVDGKDILAQESRFVVELMAGFRLQFLRGRALAGLEFQLGFTDGNLRYEAPAEALSIRYNNKRQSGLGLTLGAVLGRQGHWLVFAYGNETTRCFDVSVRSRGASFRQTDEQGMLKYGLGVERQVWRGFKARATAGRLRVDFGDQITNINVADKWDFTLGVTYQFRLRRKPSPANP